MHLFLQSGQRIEGKSVGADCERSGELVFTTGMVGYVETLTDPSYKDQIIVFSYPLLGNYGVPDGRFFESQKIHAAGALMSVMSDTYAHAEAREGLSEWLKREGVPALEGVDTRALTKLLRNEGSQLAGFSISNRKPRHFDDPNQRNLVAEVSPTTVTEEGTGNKTVVLLDCGAKENIARSLVARGVKVIRVPWDYDLSQLSFDGLLVSNGPGDPKKCGGAVKQIQYVMEKGKPIFGICLGNQLLARAAGAKTFKLLFGHRSQNQPAIDLSTGRCYITSQNHGYAVDPKTLPHDWQVWFENANDGSVEGVRHKKKPWYSVQFHPEACPGPTDTAWLFDQFVKDLH